ncbi:MAG: tRNA(Ile)-lysidine synthetase, partial [Oscillospiraceae bacterium]|nr:tRNA(Ile)-lysidine synthetase [Oscillospiraceae bacterium]
MAMTTKVLAFCRRHMLLDGVDTLLCAVSGGADSMALLQLFCSEREAFGLRQVAACHLNHG